MADRLKTMMGMSDYELPKKYGRLPKGKLIKPKRSDLISVPAPKAGGGSRRRKKY